MNTKQSKIVKKLLNKEKLDALLITSNENRFWYSGFSSTAGFILVTKTKAFFILDNRYFEAANKPAACKNINEFILLSSVYEQINDLIKKENIKILGLEKEYITYQNFDIFTEKLTTSLKPVNVQHLRMIKDISEIRKIKKAAQIGDRVFNKLLKKINLSKVKKGKVSERDIEQIIVNLMLKYGAMKPSFDTIVASGARSSMPHAKVSNKKIAENEIITCDFGVIYEGFCSDMTRTFVVGKEVDKKLQEIYNIVYEAQQKGIEAIKPGVKCSDIDNICRKYIEEKGYGEYFVHGTGHGVGIEIHEDPYINNKDNTLLAAGMVVTVEPGIYIPEFGGVRIEDDILVTKNGYKVLTSSPSKDLIYLTE